MRNWRTTGKQAAVLAAVASLAMGGASTAVAQESKAPGEVTAMACGSGGVFLDGLRALDVLEEGQRDEVYIMADFHGTNRKIWPANAPYVSVAEGQRVEVDKCVPAGAKLRLWDYDDVVDDDFMGVIWGVYEDTYDTYFDNGASRYRLGVVA